MKFTTVPSLSGNKLIALLKKNGWIESRRVTHGVSLIKVVGGRYRVTVIPTKSSSLPEGTLMAILSEKQTGLGKKGLLDILNRTEYIG